MTMIETDKVRDEGRPFGYSRDELNISPETAQLLGVIDDQEDGDVIALALEIAVLALVDISGQDPNRPTIARPGKLATRSLSRIVDVLEDEET